MKKIMYMSTLTLSLMFSSIMMMMDTPLLMWIMMEISNMMFIMLFTMMQMKNINTPALMLLVQFFSSTLMLMSIINKSNLLMSSSIMIKLGLYPAHNWIPMIIFMSPWKLNSITLIIPKIPPFLMMNNLLNNTLMSMSISITTLIIVLKLMKTNNNKVIMAMSSLLHSSWMVMAQMISSKCWMMYFMLYSMNTLMICSMMSMNMNIQNKMYNKNKMMYLMIMFSMMGNPPTTMFMGKMFLISMSSLTSIVPLLILIIGSSLSILFYSRMFMKSMLMFKTSNKILSKYKYPENMKTKWILLMLMLLLIM